MNRYPIMMAYALRLANMEKHFISIYSSFCTYISIGRIAYVSCCQVIDCLSSGQVIMHILFELMNKSHKYIIWCTQFEYLKVQPNNIPTAMYFVYHFTSLYCVHTLHTYVLFIYEYWKCLLTVQSTDQEGCVYPLVFTLLGHKRDFPLHLLPDSLADGKERATKLYES